MKTKLTLIKAGAVIVKRNSVLKKIFLVTLLLTMLACYAIDSYAQTGVTKLGTNALANNTTDGIYNTALGYYSLNANTSGNKNTGTGANSLRFNTTGVYNTATGYAALYNNKTGTSNTAFGLYSLFSNTASNNTAYGTYSLQANTSGSYNTATGYKSLNSNISGERNTANGYNSLYSNTYGYRNTANGYDALYYNTSGFYNTASGYAALYHNTTGMYNIALGYFADVSTGNLTNSTVIGYNATVDASNKVRIGNASVTSIGGQVGWTTFSDGRFKRDIKENIQGLAFINSLRPISYTVNVKGLNEYYNKERNQSINDGFLDNEDRAVTEEMAKAEDAASKIVHNGFIAQEVEEAAKKLNFEFGGVDKPQTKDGLYGLRYENFIVPLVKAIQELSKQNEDLQKQINELKAMKTGNAQTDVSSQSSTKIMLANASLEQNAPNPFSNTTTIRYNILAGTKNAQLTITDNFGKTIKQITLNPGKGVVNIDASVLSSGTYNYTLLVDGRLIESKKMVVAH